VGTPLATAESLPDYGGGSILNLVASITTALGAPEGPYPGLRRPDLLELLGSRDRVVLIVVDGLGHRHLTHGYPGSSLGQYLRGSLTSVFPSTTATAITAFMTGLAPAQHGITGWHMYIPEVDAIGAVLPLRTRSPDRPLTALGLDPERFYDQRSLFDRLPVRSFVVSPERIVDSEFNRHHSGSAGRRGYGSLEQLFASILSCLRASGEARYVYAYYADFDSVAHQHGVNSGKADRVMRRFDTAFSAFLTQAAGLNATVIVTADHGFIDSPPERLIELDDHPDLQATLRLPLCGERRAAYCYVRPGMARDFEDYVRDALAEQVHLFASETLVAQGWFGPGTPHPRLTQRIGDYTLIMKEDWTIKDWLQGEERHRQVGVHGGLSADEMVVPLVVVQP
jgi:predicted AlkP superfamily pyrophosphatase or phosphodiesterase